MKKFLFMFLLAAAVAGAFPLALAEEETQGEEKKFVIHGEIRQRADFIDNFYDFNDDWSDSALFFPYRARIAAEGHFSKNVIGYAEFQAFGVWGDAPPEQGGLNSTWLGSWLGGPLSTPNVDQNTSNNILYNVNDTQLYQAWIGLNEIGGSKFSLKVGRQEIVKGSEMLLGDRDFYSGIAHDGVVGDANYDSFGLDLRWTRPLQGGGVIPGYVGWPTTLTPDHQSTNFYGAWADFKKIPKNIGLSAYLMRYETGLNWSLISTPALMPYSFYTVGARANKDAEAGKNGFAWNAELAVQSGEFYYTAPGDGDISTMGFEGMFGYNLNVGENDHLFKVKYVMASGNLDTADPDYDGSKYEKFLPMFQDYHFRYGMTDLFTFSNLTAASLGWKMRMNDHCFGVDYWMFETTEDVYIATGTSTDLASEVDAYWKYQYNPNTQFMAGLAYVMPGDVIEYDYGYDDAGIRLVGNLRLRF